MAYDNFISVVKGTLAGTSLADTKRLEDSVGAGRNAYLMALLQLAQGFQAVTLVESALEISKKSSLPLSVGRFIYLTPILLAIASKRGIENPYIRTAVIFIQDHYGTLCHVASVVSSITLIYFGNPFFGVPTLVILGIGYLDRKGLLPERTRHFIHKYSEFFTLVSSVFVGTPVNRFFTAVTCIAYLVKYYFTSKNAQILASIQLPPLSYDVATVKDILRGNWWNLEVNRDYIKYPCMPIAPKIDIGALVAFFKAIRWENHIGALRGKLQDNQRFVQREGNVSAKTDAFLIKYVTDNMTDLIESVKNRQILAGEPLDYERLENYLKLITQKLDKENDQISKVDQLLRLAVEGGKHCGPGIFEVAEELSVMAVNESAQIPFQTKILNALQTSRVHIFQAFYQQITENQRMIGHVVDWNDVHSYNQFLNLYGNQWGLRRAGADNDATAAIDPMYALLLSPLEKKFTNILWNQHDRYNIVAALQEEKGGSLPKPDFFKWWADWIEGTTLPPQQKEHLTEELLDYEKNTLFAEKISDLKANNKMILRENVIYAMLYCMGIFKKNEPQPLPQTTFQPHFARV